jgi:ABC-type polysaccharide/polyol phosphate export permease
MKDKVQLLLYFLKKDIKSRYAGSGLGFAWTILMPLVQILLFWFVFSGILKARPYANAQTPYVFFLLSSFFFWLAFSEGLSRASNAIVENAEIVKKISFPLILLPITVTISCYLLNMVGFLIFIVFYSITTSLNPLVIFVIPVLLLQFLFSVGLGLLLAALMPYIRDIGQVLGQILMGMFFLSPIIYSIEAVPEKLRLVLYCNPMTYFASSYQHIILLKKLPPVPFVGVIVVLSLTTLMGGLFVFRKLRDGFADVL